MNIENEYNKWVATEKEGLGNNELYQFTKSELIDFGKHLTNSSNDIQNVSDTPPKPFDWLKDEKAKIPQGATWRDVPSINLRRCASWIEEYVNKYCR